MQHATSTHTPYQMVTRLLDGAMLRLDGAVDELANGHAPSLPAAVSIIEALRDSLDLARGGALAGNLLELYGYMLRRLDQAEASRDPAGLEEVRGLLGVILEGWEAIAAQVGEPVTA